MDWPARYEIREIIQDRGIDHATDAVLALFEPLRAELEREQIDHGRTVQAHDDLEAELAALRQHIEQDHHEIETYRHAPDYLAGVERELAALRPVARAALRCEPHLSPGTLVGSVYERLNVTTRALDRALRARLLEGQ